jgi:hypothetical protein
MRNINSHGREDNIASGDNEKKTHAPCSSPGHDMRESLLCTEMSFYLNKGAMFTF